ncbi:MAG: glutathione peroxidase [Planctomycetes bacterium]|nr:glutathione peroxidase [Planctomycetota bacterium]
MSFYALSAASLDATPANLAAHAGKVTLVVNVASACGLTPQYEALQKLHRSRAAKGFAVLAFPSNDFGAQEPGTPAEIRAFCTTKYAVDFPLFAKVQTKAGPGQSPVYAFLHKATGKLPGWNFGKYLIGRDGNVLGFFEPTVAPDDPALVAAIDRALG